jgi:hypothetical protein
MGDVDENTKLSKLGERSKNKIPQLTIVNVVFVANKSQ